MQIQKFQSVPTIAATRRYIALIHSGLRPPECSLLRPKRHVVYFPQCGIQPQTDLRCRGGLFSFGACGYFQLPMHIDTKEVCVMRGRVENFIEDYNNWLPIPIEYIIVKAERWTMRGLVTVGTARKNPLFLLFSRVFFVLSCIIVFVSWYVLTNIFSLEFTKLKLSQYVRGSSY